tara:strand:+ start:393 stop:656 length:264 start_codon:yes stop_codon:yes gene_type:complete
MSLNIEELKKKIIYRSSYRGTKEMSILLYSFATNLMDKLNENELKNLLNLLNIDDDNLYKFKRGLKTNIEIEDTNITKLFKTYDYKK